MLATCRLENCLNIQKDKTERSTLNSKLSSQTFHKTAMWCCVHWPKGRWSDCNLLHLIAVYSPHHRRTCGLIYLEVFIQNPPFVQCCFTSTETVHTDYWGRGAQDVLFVFHTAPDLWDVHTAPELWAFTGFFFFKCCFTSTETIRIHLDVNRHKIKHWIGP